MKIINNKEGKPNRKPKICATAYRVLSLFLILNEKDHNIDELTEFFSKDPNIGKIYTDEVVIKYIKTLREVGFTITKKNSAYFNRYSIQKSPFLFEFDEKNLRTLAIVEDYINNIQQYNFKKQYNNVINKIQRFLSDEQLAIFENFRTQIKIHKFLDISKYEKYKELIKTWEEFCMDDFRLIVSYRSPNTGKIDKLTIEPKYIKYDNNNVYFGGYNFYSHEMQLLLIDYIVNIHKIPVKFKNDKEIYSSIVFQLKGRLTKNYRLRNEDKIVEKDSNSEILTISSLYEDKNLLFKRLLKYGESCEILYPQNIRYEFVNFIKDTMKNYTYAENQMV